MAQLRVICMVRAPRWSEQQAASRLLYARDAAPSYARWKRKGARSNSALGLAIPEQAELARVPRSSAGARRRLIMKRGEMGV